MAKKNFAVNLLRKTTRLLVFVALGLLAFIGIRFFSAPDASVPLAEIKVTPADEENFRLASEADPKPFAEYAAVFEARDIFESPFEKEAITPVEEPRPVETVAPVKDLTNDFLLVGIVIDDDPRAIIEDIQNQETLFLSVGEHLGEAVIKEIHEGRVVLDYQGNEIELFP